MRRRIALLCFLGLHGGLVLSVASRDLFRLIARGYTDTPSALQEFSGAGDRLIHAALGGDLRSGHPAAQLVRGYLHGAGIEAGYSYFAPNVGGGYRLAFEFQFADGRVEYDAFAPESREAELRLDGLLDQIVKSPSPAMREVLVKFLALTAARRHPEARRVKAVIAAQHLPDATEFKTGKRQSYEFVHAYEFDLPDDKTDAPGP